MSSYWIMMLLFPKASFNDSKQWYLGGENAAFLYIFKNFDLSKYTVYTGQIHHSLCVFCWKTFQLLAGIELQTPLSRHAKICKTRDFVWQFVKQAYSVHYEVISPAPSLAKQVTLPQAQTMAWPHRSAS